jgi:archaellum biogenesis ATPase FlaH
LESKKIEVQDFKGEGNKVVTVGELINSLIKTQPDLSPNAALLRIAAKATLDGKIKWEQLVAQIMEPVTSEEKAAPIEPEKVTADQLLNPFFNRIAIKDPRYFFGRDEEVHYLMSLLRNSQSCSIIGPRRIGKSSLINYISNPEILKKSGLEPNEFIFVSIDLEGLEQISQSEFFQIMIDEIRNQSTEEELRDRIERLLERETIRFLDLKNIIRQISDSGKKIIFLLDEFELITNNTNLDSNFFSGLRNLANSYNVGYLTASHTTLLELTFSKETLGSPFFNFFTQIELGLISEQKTEELIGELSKESGVKFQDEIIEFIRSTGGNHPFFLQMLCFHVFEWLIENQSISDQDYETISNYFQTEAEPHFEYFWNHLEPAERKLLHRLGLGQQLDLPSVDPKVLTGLKKKALIVEVDEGVGIFSKAFSNYVAEKKEGGSDRKPGSESDNAKQVPASVDEIKIEYGCCYFVDEDEPKISVNIFNDLTERQIPGLFISRTPGEKAEKVWGIKTEEIFWLCTKQGEGFITPNVQKILHTIFEFVKQKPQSVIYLDGLEYLINHNDFQRTLALMDNIKENIAVHNSIFIFPMSSTIFSEREMGLMGKNSIEIGKETRFDFSNLKK